MIHIQQVTTEKKEQASRTKPVPPQLIDLLKLANSIGWDGREWQVEENLPSESSPDEHFSDFKWLIEKNFPESVFSYFRKYLGSFKTGKTLRDFLFHRAEMLEKWRFVLDVREVLRKIYEEVRLEDDQRPVQLPEISASVRKDDRGLLKVIPNPILIALDGVEVDRIRRCQVCVNFFWAGRIDQTCCTPKCAKVLRTRRWRERYLENYKYQRYEKDKTSGPK